MGSSRLRVIATKALEGVGDASLGQWEEWTGKAYHVRRRLTIEEQELVGPVIDVRGTAEGINRINAVMIVNPWLPQELISAEMNSL